jgi:allantoate deiminase
MRRCAELGGVSDEPHQLTRTFRSPAMARANALVARWMREAGLEVRTDAAANLWGRWRSARGAGGPSLVIGSHLDTVPNAGRYDGPLGVLAGIATVSHLRERGVDLAFDVEIVGFSDEEGVRHQTAYLGSGAVAGTLSAREMRRIGETGLAAARRRAREILGYVEVHIEQGPVLEARGLPLGVVRAIVGQSRIRVDLEGRAGHAGTTPMAARRDALCGAAELVLAAERCGVTATVGRLDVLPGASNVIPGRATLTLDVRHARDARREQVVAALARTARTIAQRRGLGLTWTLVQSSDAVDCDRAWTKQLAACVAASGFEVASLPSGAGHDGVAMSALGPIAMLFVRCKDGVSHHPDESVKTSDVAHAIAVLADFVGKVASRL